MQSVTAVCAPVPDVEDTARVIGAFRGAQESGHDVTT